MTMTRTPRSDPAPTNGRSFPALLRAWRQRRRLSQLELAGDAEISTKHLSFLETGRAKASREMVLRLAERLRIPLRDQNALLLAAGYAPVFSNRDLDDAELAPARRAIDRVLAAYEPFPALAFDRHWNLVSGNQAIRFFLELDISPALLEPPINLLKLSLHPQGLGAHVLNLREWRRHIFARLAEQIEASGDMGLAALLADLESYPEPAPDGRLASLAERQGRDGSTKVAVALLIETPKGRFAFWTMTTVFGTPLDVTLSELAIEAFLPADEATAAMLRELSER